MKYYKQIMALGVGLLSLPLCSCDGETKTVDRKVVVSGDQNLNLVGKVFGEGGDFKFEFISETRVKISENSQEDDSPLLAGEYDYTVDKNEVLINLKSTFRNQSGAEALSLFNDEITNNPTGSLAVAYQNLVADILAKRPLVSYETFYNEALAFFISNGVQVSLESVREVEDSIISEPNALDLTLFDEISLIIGQESQFVKLQIISLLLKNSGGVEEEDRDPVIIINTESSIFTQ